MIKFSNKYNSCIERLLKKEGGYVNDSDDAGGQTYRGISRKYNPNWKGWVVVDNYLKEFGGETSAFKKALDRNEILLDQVKLYYKERYWDVLNLDTCKNFKVCWQLFDTCVNTGKTNAVKLAQKVLGLKVTGKADEEFYLKLSKIN